MDWGLVAAFDIQTSAPGVGKSSLGPSEGAPPAERAVVGQCTAGHQAMEVDMLIEGLPPGVEHRRHAEHPIQALGITSKRLQRAPGGLEEESMDDLRVKLHPTV